MSAQVAPSVPPRPTRAQQASAAQGANKLPEVPPRPINKRLERSVSPGHYPRSPLNEPWHGNFARQKANDQTEAMPRRPSVQHLPSLGQEGMEYGEIMEQASQQPSASAPPTESAAQTRNIAQDLKLHAPKPSLPKSSAAAQIQAVTRTDSQQAAQHGIGKPSTPAQDEDDTLGRSRTRTSFSRPSSTAGNERRSSIYGEESGPAELGLRVPINPLLGDVQAPTPGMTPAHTGENGAYRKLHSRSKSRDISAPPGSYGLHGHGVIPQDKFEKDWYAKHPEAAHHEETTGHGVYESIGSGRGSFALSSGDLNKIVRETAIRGAGYGTSGTTYSYPDEQIGYAASEVFVSRSQMNTPNSLARTITNSSQPAVESPLRKASFPADGTIPAEVRRGRLSVSGRSDDHEAIESEAEQEVQIQPPRRRFNKITGGEGTLDETQEAQPYASHPTGEDNYVNEHGYTVPILAADEVAKEVGIEHLQPAVSPRAERRGSELDMDFRSGNATPASRPSSRPSSIYGQNASLSAPRSVPHLDERDSVHTPLEDVEEYEPLFPDDDDKQKPLSHAERFKQRPNSLRQRFPSQDIWEDTPSSALHSATVSTPDLPIRTEGSQNEEPVSTTFETPEQEAARKQEPSEEERRKLIPKDERLAKSKFAPHLRDDMPTRPGSVPRFPSSDIWEDTPESHRLVAVVSTPPVDEEDESPAEVEIKPSVPPRPADKSRLGEGASTAQVAPSVSRPQNADQAVPPEGTSHSKGPSTSPTELKKVPSIPDRPKPQIPARPTKKTVGEGLNKTQSRDSAGSTEQGKVSPPITKAKPQIPARPAVGSKIANLRGNFMNDLNQKLGLGPPKEKEPEPVAEEAKPLEDARKARARGPQRRAPAKPSTAAAAPPQFSIFTPRALWTIDDAEEVNVLADEPPNAGDVKVEDSPVKAKDSSQQARQEADSTAADTATVLTSKATDPAENQDERLGDKSAQETTNTTGASAEPSLETPMQEKSNPLSHNPSEEDVPGLSQRTTASTAEASGPELEKEVPDPNTDAIPASKQTTAGTDAGTVSLERSPQDPRAVKPTEGEPGKASAEEV